MSLETHAGWAAKPQALKIIDADTHLSEPHDLWLKRAPASMRARVPQVGVVDGKPSWVIDGDKSIGFGASAASAILKDGSKPKGLYALDEQIDGVYRAAWDVKARLKYMDENGFWAHIMYPNVLGFGGHRATNVDVELRLLSTRIYNDAMAEIQAESGNRIFGMALLPWWDPKLAAQETERCAAMGLRGVAINSDPQYHKAADGAQLPDLGHPFWDPLWDACDGLKMPVNFHIGGSEASWDWVGAQGWPSLPTEMAGAVTACMLFMNNARVAANLLMCGLFDRYPNLKFVSVESGVGWMPFLLEALDYQVSEFGSAKHFELTPSEYFRRNMYACFWFEQRDISHQLVQLGLDNVMFETDFPHPTCLYPNPLERQAESLAGLDEAARRKVLSGNAAKLYRIPLD